MKRALISVWIGSLLLGLPACSKKEKAPVQVSAANQVSIHDVASQKTVAAAEKFSATHKLSFSKQTLDVMRQQGEQIPSSALGAHGRV